MVSIDSLTFDLTNCSLEEQSENHRMWVNSVDVAHKLQFDIGPIDWPFDLTDSTAGAEYYRRQCEELGGAMLSLEVTMTAGVAALRGLFKYRAPNSIAMYYVGILWLPFQECRFQINVEAMETGLTGAREAVALIVDRDSFPSPSLDTPPLHFENGEVWESFRPPESVPGHQWPSDNEQYDELLPNHPLSKVRRRLTEVMATLELDASAKSLTPFRIRRGWRFWR